MLIFIFMRRYEAEGKEIADRDRRRGVCPNRASVKNKNNLSSVFNLN
ncbi:hypothetical protein [Pleurocapsa sp. PCC 7319]|nr:hypothetical protein [Pleurocapsa sp. PCC 7319]